MGRPKGAKDSAPRKPRARIQAAPKPPKESNPPKPPEEQKPPKEPKPPAVPKPRRQPAPKKEKPSKGPDMARPFIGLDGEGMGRNPHRYVLIRAADEHGQAWELANLEGLRTAAILDFILALPAESMVFGYSLNYDWTKILADLPDELLYLLFRPEERQSEFVDRKGPKPVRWGKFYLNSQGSRLSIRVRGKERIVWDIFKFFQGKFVTALKDWKVGDKALYARMTAMKESRSVFTEEQFKEIRAYCHEECVCMAQLARSLVNAHLDAGLELTSFYGAGSSATAMLKKFHIREQIVNPPEAMRQHVASAFFGGRFENSVIGVMKGPVYNNDISSAYPYQLYRLPCLLHARWRHSHRRAALDGARQALVHFSVQNSPAIEHWAPFPHRDDNGAICYPRVHPGGWIWLDEYLQGEKMWPNNVIFHEAYILETDCDCHPFKDIPYYYLERLRIGKEGAGIVFKLAPNSCYGKVAQSVGNGAFTSWCWAGMITSGTRAQLLEMMSLHSDISKVYMVATDGVFGAEHVEAPRPIDTGTFGVSKPLGGWEEKVIEAVKGEVQDVFIARPGIYFPMHPTIDQIKDCKGRGVGKGVVFDNWELISQSWDQYRDTRKVTVANVSRFCGAVTSIHRTPIRKNGDITGYRYSRADGHSGRADENVKEWPSYGEWVSRCVEMDFCPQPKRQRVLDDGFSLELRECLEPSVTYTKALKETEHPLGISMAELSEQPDGDYYL